MSSRTTAARTASRTETSAPTVSLRRTTCIAFWTPWTTVPLSCWEPHWELPSRSLEAADDQRVVTVVGRGKVCRPSDGGHGAGSLFFHCIDDTQSMAHCYR